MTDNNSFIDYCYYYDIPFENNIFYLNYLFSFYYKINKK